MLFANGVGGCVCVRLGEDVLTDQTLDMACVTRNLLVSDHMVRSALPVLCKSTIISIDDLIFVDCWYEFTAIQSLAIVMELLHDDWVLAVI
jgi:hypothetical protein